MIIFNSGSFKGDGTIEKLATYRDGGLSIPIRVNNVPETAVLLANVNKICRITASIDGNSVQAEGELVKLATLRKGQVTIDLTVSNEPRIGGFFLANVKKSAEVLIEFSSVEGKKGALPDEDDEEDEEQGQQALDFMSQAAADGGPVEGVGATDKPETTEEPGAD